MCNSKHGRVPIKAPNGSWARDRGETVCTNSVRRPMEEVDGTIVVWILEHLLQEDVVVEILAVVRRLAESEAASSVAHVGAAEAELRRVRAEITRTTTVLVATDAAPDAVTGRSSTGKRACGTFGFASTPPGRSPRH